MLKKLFKNKSVYRRRSVDNTDDCSVEYAEPLVVEDDDYAGPRQRARIPPVTTRGMAKILQNLF